MKKILSVVLCLCLICALMAGCGSKAESGAKKVTIGVFEPASGDNGPGGKQETLGIQYANYLNPTVEINGETYEVVLKIVDNESSNDKAPSAASELVSADCSVVLGSYGSGVSNAGKPIFEAAGVPVIGVTCTNPTVTEGNDFYYRVCFLDPFQGPVLANYAFKNIGASKAYCLSKLGDDYSGGLVNYFAEAFEALGGECVKEEFPEGNADFTSYITNAKNEGCGVFFSPVSIEAAQLIIKAADAQGLDIPLLAGDTWDSNVVSGAAVGTNCQVTVTTFYSDGEDPEFESNIKEWIKSDSTAYANNGDSDVLAAVTVMGFDAYNVALEALRQAGSTDPAAVKAALANVEWDGVSGHIRFNETGDAIVNVAYVKTADNETGLYVGGGSVSIDN